MELPDILGRSYLDPFVIAEIGVNHEGSLERAKSLISSAARAGAHAAKFQTYRAATLASAGNSPAYWDVSKEPTRSQYELFRKYDGFGEEDYAALADHCRSLGIMFMSTPFDLDAVDMLAPLVPAFKIASADLTNIPLLRKVARAGKPVVLSVGASSEEEIDHALRTLEQAGATRIGLLHCVLNYPTSPERANLSAISWLTERFGARALVGYSDHVPPAVDGEMPALEMAAILGARVLEKHFTDDRNASGNDHYHAADEHALRRFTKRIAEYRVMSGPGFPVLEHQSSAMRNARRRIFVTRDLMAGSQLSESDLIALRANVGVEISRWDEVVGRVILRAISAGDPITDDDLDD
ncbi:MAG TPA: N-acetylneuraminate synthase family protein [Microbacteriaceae bacterium]|nr:N-acetylneuraminate synthase family protein [Microbacteriaceae bacterium]